MISDALLDDHHRNPVRQAFQNYLRSPEASHLLTNVLMKYEGIMEAITGHVKKCAEKEVELSIGHVRRAKKRGKPSTC